MNSPIVSEGEGARFFASVDARDVSVLAVVLNKVTIVLKSGEAVHLTFVGPTAAAGFGSRVDAAMKHHAIHGGNS